jgi:hypothetical protein
MPCTQIDSVLHTESCIKRWRASSLSRYGLDDVYDSVLHTKLSIQSKEAAARAGEGVVTARVTLAPCGYHLMRLFTERDSEESWGSVF